jgi:methionyl-tRNA formyltransferase
VINILLFTSQDLGNDVVPFLRARRDVRLWVVTRRTKRDEIYGYRSTFDLCLRDGVPMIAAKPFEEEFFAEVEKIAPDLVVCAFYPRIFPTRLLKIPPLGCITVHPGRLPDYRGPFCTPWCILNGESEIGITLHYMDAGIDTGEIWMPA